MNKMETLEVQTVGNIVADDFRTAAVFKKYGIDFCCGGKNTLADACEQKGLDIEAVLVEIEGLSDTNTNTQNFKEWSSSFLIDYIINNHHHYVRSKLPEIKVYAKKVARVHGQTYPVLEKMLETFLTLKREMLSHLDAEEQLLFPYIKKMEEARKEGRKPRPELQSASAARAVRMMEEEHEEAGELMAQLEAMSDGFTPPQDACTTFRIYFQNLEAFRDDLHQHVHLENNILFPKALQLEKQLL